MQDRPEIPHGTEDLNPHHHDDQQAAEIQQSGINPPDTHGKPRRRTTSDRGIGQPPRHHVGAQHPKRLAGEVLRLHVRRGGTARDQGLQGRETLNAVQKLCCEVAIRGLSLRRLRSFPRVPQRRREIAINMVRSVDATARSVKAMNPKISTGVRKVTEAVLSK